MSSTTFRSDAPVPPPPPPPPLPPQRYGHRAATAIARLTHPLFYGSRPPSAQGNRSDERRSTAFRSSVQRASSPLFSKNAIHKTGIPITAVDISPSRTHAILAGRDILKTIQIQGATCTEEFNLRSSIIAYAATHNTSRDAVSAQHKDQLAANDVKWSHGRYEFTIATAAANGRIVLYDINRAGVELARLHEHTRQVHRVAFNPHQGALLLSGSQDATIRMWDLRDLSGDRSIMTCRSINRYSGNNEGIRDLRWSPTDGVEFAACTDNGVVQRWDFRKETAPLLKINAHDKTCHSIDWHPSGKYLASGGADKNVKVWDFKSSDRRMKPLWHLRAPQGIMNIRWRPLGRPTDDGTSDTHQCTQLATSYDQRDPRIHVWDFRRPHVPYQELDRYDTSASDLLWRDKDLLWSVGTTGMFTQSDMSSAPKPLSRLNINIMASAPNGSIGFLSKKREYRRMSVMEASPDFIQRSSTEGSSGEKFSSSHSATDGSYEEATILGSITKRRRARNTGSRFHEHTPPSTHGSLPIGLEDILRAESRDRSSQIGAIGHVLGIFDIESFKYLAKHYQSPFWHEITQQSKELPQLISALFEGNAGLAARTGQYRLAQTWRILGIAVQNELIDRAEKARKLRRTHSPYSTLKSSQDRLVHPTVDSNSKLENERSTIRSPSAPNFESTSNMPTPLAKPVQGLSNVSSSPDDLLNPDEENSLGILGLPWKTEPNSPERSFVATLQETFDIDPTANSSLDTHNIDAQFEMDLQDQKFHPAIESFTDIDQHMHERRAAMNNYRLMPRPIFRLEEPANASKNLSVAPRLDRQDSSESFEMFSASTDSGHRSMSLAGSFGDVKGPNLSEPLPERWDLSLNKDTGHNGAVDVLDKNKNSIDLSQSVVCPQPSDIEQMMDTQIPVSLNPRAPLEPLRRPSNPLLPLIHLNGLNESCNSKKKEAPAAEDDFRSSDFLPPRSSSATVAYTRPWCATALLPHILEFHLSSVSDSQFPAFLILYLSTLFPSIFDFQYATTILLTYHKQLTSLNLPIEAAALRNYCYPTYPEVWEHAVGTNRVGGWFCTTCMKPVKGNKSGSCARCRRNWGLCPICESIDSPLPFPSADLVVDEDDGEIAGGQMGTRLWAWCQECGHGGHDSCLRLWWADAEDSEGACPCQGCLHDCMPGIRRDERMREIEAAKKKAKMKVGGIIKDGWVVRESKAVEGARDLVGVTIDTVSLEDVHVASGFSDPSGALSVGLGLGGKRVRLLVPQGEPPGGVEGLEAKDPDDATASRSMP